VDKSEDVMLKINYSQSVLWYLENASCKCYLLSNCCPDLLLYFLVHIHHKRNGCLHKTCRLSLLLNKKRIIIAFGSLMLNDFKNCSVTWLTGLPADCKIIVNFTI
jgi:hypothetical protein